jgi:hypothetical protein
MGQQEVGFPSGKRSFPTFEKIFRTVSVSYHLLHEFPSAERGFYEVKMSLPEVLPSPL